MSRKQAPRRGSRQPNITSITYWRKFASHRIIYVGLAGLIGFGIIAYFGSSPLGNPGTSAREDYLQDAICTVNREPVTRDDYENLARNARRQSGGNVMMTVMQEGYILSSLTDAALLRAEAKKRRIQVSDQDVDRTLNEMRNLRQGGRTERLTDQDLLQMTGSLSLSDLKDKLRKDLLPQRLGEIEGKVDRLTYDDLAKSYDEIKVRHILIGVVGPRAPGGKGLPDDQARQKAENIKKELDAGADFAQLANRYSDDPSNKPARAAPKGGDLGWYKRGGGFDKDFEAAAFALKPGQISGVVKTPFGYHIIKVDESRRSLPKDFEKNKTELLTQYRSQKASEALRALLERLKPKAKIVWKDSAMEWRYEYAKSGPMGGMMTIGQDRSQAEERLVKRLRAYVPAHKSDSAAAIVLGQLLNQQLMMISLPQGIAGTVPPKADKIDRKKLQAEIIAAYESALNVSEDQDTRLTLARMYREEKNDRKALDHYRMVHRLMEWDDRPESLYVREQVEKALRELGDTKLADEEAKRIAELRAQQAKEQKEAAERAKQEQDRQKAEAAKTDETTSGNSPDRDQSKTPAQNGRSTPSR